MSYDFDKWAEDFSISNRDGEIWGAPYFEKMMKIVQNNGDIEEFIKSKDQDLHDRYIEEKIPPIKEDIAHETMQISEFQHSSAQIENINNMLNEYERDIANLIKHYPASEEQIDTIKCFLSEYKYDGKFDKFFYDKLTQKPRGFLNKVIHWKKHKKAQQYLSAFIEKYEALNIPEKISKSGLKNTWNLEQKLDAIIGINKDNVAFCSDNIQEDIRTIDEKILRSQRHIEEDKQRIQFVEKSFTESVLISREDAVIRSFCNEIRDEIQHPNIFNVSDYVECLDKLPEDEVVMFNVGLKSGKNVADKIKNIMAYNELDCGNDTNQWLIRENDGYNSDRGKFEIFSPLMTVNKAKEIMPKLIADFDRAHISSGIVVPIKAAQLFKEHTQNEPEPEISQDGLMKLIVRDCMKKETEQEQPQVFSSLKEIEAQYPKEQFLFSGSTASDDYLAISARSGRNGIIYATPNINYAALYDGVTNTGKGEGVTATGDKYVSPVIGQLSEQDVKVGFINIYEQSNDDKYFPNFGMEDYRKDIDSSPRKHMDSFEANGDGRDQFTSKQTQTAINGSITKNQAILSHDAETYVTPEKNPLKAKIMHIEWGKREFFVVVPDKQNETIQAIINMRRAQMENTFSHNGRGDIQARLQKQKEEFTQGKISPVREKDFIQKQLGRLKTTLTRINSGDQTGITNKPKSTSELIGLLRGTIPQPEPKVNRITSNQNNPTNRQPTRI